MFGRDCRWLHFDLKGFNVYWSLPQQNPFNLSPGVSWGGIKNQSKSTWCQSGLIQFSINKTFQTVENGAGNLCICSMSRGEKDYLTIIYLVTVKEVALAPLFHRSDKRLNCVRSCGCGDTWDWLNAGKYQLYHLLHCRGDTGTRGNVNRDQIFISS